MNKSFYWNWRTLFIAIATIIFGFSLYLSIQLSKKLGKEEKKRVEILVEAIKEVITSESNDNIEFALNIVSSNETIPLIITDESNTILDFKNISIKPGADTSQILHQEIDLFKQTHEPIIFTYQFGTNLVYYGESALLKELRWLPLIQLGIIFTYIVVLLITLNISQRSIQNQVWVGLSKETAHQLGTPLSSIQGWLELLRDKPENEPAVNEMQSDLDRLNLIADRFGKIGNQPELKETDIIPHLENMVQYMQLRSPNKVQINLHHQEPHILVNLSAPLFDWVIENLIRNALDALEGSGQIDLFVSSIETKIVIDVCDNGKGIPANLHKKIFHPGFTTKKRGWGLGLSLAKRIINQYHGGELFVKWSEIGKGTRFRIILRR